MAPITPASSAAQNGLHEQVAAYSGQPASEKGPPAGAKGDQRETEWLVIAEDHSERGCSRCGQQG